MGRIEETQEDQKEPKEVLIREVPINLELINEKLNHLISLVQSQQKG